MSKSALPIVPSHRGARLTTRQQEERFHQSLRGVEDHRRRWPILSGVILRVGTEYWRWQDGACEARIRDYSAHEWGSPLRSTSGGTLVEVRRTVFERVPVLRWVVEGWRAGRLEAALAGAADARPGAAGRERRTVAWPGEAPRATESAWLEGRDAAPAAVLVPVHEWNVWVAANPVAAAWDSDQDAEILGRAYGLGWRPAPGYVSPGGWAVPQTG